MAVLFGGIHTLDQSRFWNFSSIDQSTDDIPMPVHGR